MPVSIVNARKPISVQRHSFFLSFRTHRVLWLMLVPAIVYFVIFAYLPMAGIWFAFTRYSYSLGFFGSPFVGLRNFQYLFKSGILWRLVRNTVLYNLAFILIGNAVQIACAVFLSELRNKKFVMLSQSIIFLPYFISMVLIGLFSYALFNVDTGVINTVLRSLHVSEYNFYLNATCWPPIIVAIQVWKGLGYGSIVYLSVISAIDPEFYEAARMDGAKKWQQIRYLTLPMIKPTFLLLFMFNLGSILKGQFQLFYQIIGNNGLLYNMTDIIDTYVYRSLTVNFDIGMGSAAGVFQSVFGFILIVSVNAVMRKINQEYALF